MKSKNRIFISTLLITLAILNLFRGCKKNDDNAPILFNPSITYGSVTDQDGNKYKTVTIGTQVWMAENLKTTKYRNGDLIPFLRDSSGWRKSKSGAYCYYNNETKNIDTYGFLYNHYAVADSRNLAPEGWHVATYSDWSLLTDLMGGEDVAGIRLKEAGTSHWLNTNSATNESGFTALPGGYRFKWQIITGRGMEYGTLGTDGNWWGLDGTAWIYYDTSRAYELTGTEDKSYGLSVRCVKD